METKAIDVLQRLRSEVNRDEWRTVENVFRVFSNVIKGLFVSVYYCYLQGQRQKGDKALRLPVSARTTMCFFLLPFRAFSSLRAPCGGCSLIHPLLQPPPCSPSLSPLWKITPTPSPSDSHSHCFNHHPQPTIIPTSVSAHVSESVQSGLRERRFRLLIYDPVFPALTPFGYGPTNNPAKPFTFLCDPKAHLRILSDALRRATLYHRTGCSLTLNNATFTLQAVCRGNC